MTLEEIEWSLWSSHSTVIFFTFLSNSTFFIIFLPLFLSLSPLALPLLENMEISKAEGKRSMKDRGKEEDNKKKRALTHSDKKGSGGGSTQPCCQVEDCTANMSNAKSYHRRHKVCEFHAKAPVVLVAGIQQRFCQQCSRFHELSEFDDTKRSCRSHLLGHNERRRKSSYDLPGEGSGRMHISCQQINERNSNDLP